MSYHILFLCFPQYFLSHFSIFILSFAKVVRRMFTFCSLVQRCKNKNDKIFLFCLFVFLSVYLQDVFHFHFRARIFSMQLLIRIGNNSCIRCTYHKDNLNKIFIYTMSIVRVQLLPDVRRF